MPSDSVAPRTGAVTRLGVAAQRSRHARAALSAALGARRALQPVARPLGPLLLHAEGPRRAGRLRDVPQPGRGRSTASCATAMQVEARALVTPLRAARPLPARRSRALRPAGLGPLYERFLRLKEKLEREGLFDPAAKTRAARATRARSASSPRCAAAALRDVLTTLARRNPSVPVIVYPAPVQGEGAAERIAAMLAQRQRARRMRRAAARARRRLDRGPLAVQRGSASRAPSAPRASRWSSASATRPTSPSPTSPPTGARRRRPRRPSSRRPSRADMLAARSRSARAALSREMRRRLQYAVQALDGCARRLVHPAERLRARQQTLTQLRTRLALRLRASRASLRGRARAPAGRRSPASIRRRCSRAATASPRCRDGEVLRDASQARAGRAITHHARARRASRAR